jgi:hypothetical protein
MFATDPSFADKIVGGQYLRLDGTSMATPHVSGVAALIRAANPSLSPEQVRFVLRATTTNFIDPVLPFQLGTGLVDAGAAVDWAHSNATAARTVAAFTAPAPGSLGHVWDSAFTVKGTATGPSFAYYTIETSPSSGNFPFTQVYSSSTQVTNGVLANITGRYPAGQYFVRLRVYDVNGRYNEAYTQFLSDPTMKAGWPLVTENIYENPTIQRSPAVADLDGDGRKEVVYTGWQSVYVTDAQGVMRTGFPVQLPYPIATSPTVADLDDDGQQEIYVVVNAPYDQPNVYGFRADGTLVPGYPSGKIAWPGTPVDVVGTGVPALAADVDGDGKLDLVAVVSTIFSYTTGAGATYVVALDGSGLPKSGYPKLVSYEASMDYRPFAAGDLDGDGKAEVIVSRYGWGPELVVFSSTGPEVDITPGWNVIRRVVVVDTHMNGGRNLFIVGYDFMPGPKRATLTTPQGLPLPGWPVVVSNDYNESDPVGAVDVNGDGKLDLIAGAFTTFSIYNPDGTQLPGYPVFIGYPGLGAFNERELIFTATESAPGGAFLVRGQLGEGTYLDDAFLQPLPGYPKSEPFYGLGGLWAVADLDGSGRVDIIEPSSSGSVYVWEEPSPGGREQTSLWSTQHANNQRTNAVVSFPRSYATMYLRGTFNGWMGLKMTLKGSHLWEATFDTTAASGSFKLDVNDDWVTNWGDNNKDGIGDAGGANIAYTGGAGLYRVRFNDSTRAYAVKKVGAGSSWQRTVVFIKAVPPTGQNVFLRGGLDATHAQALGVTCTQANNLCSIPIKHLNPRDATTVGWKQGDTLLDWYGIQTGQGTGALGSPTDWTTHDWTAALGTPKRTVSVDGYGETPLNAWGDAYWMLDVQMDCSKTSDGWFEVKAFISGSGAGTGWEGNVTQPGAPYVTGNHFARCGMISTFTLNQPAATFLPL